MAASGFLTRYQPNFCAECGAKLLRLHWHFWTSRKFCNECARSLRRHRFGAVSLVVLMLFGAGFVVGRFRRPVLPTLIIERRADSPLNEGLATSTPSQAPAKTPPSEDVYICGARTKKGTPCSRRVHGPVRCWQHKGMPAMLPPEKLVVKD